MNNQPFDPRFVRPLFETSDVSQYINGKLETVDQEQKIHIEESLLGAFRKAFADIEFLTVVDGKLSNIQNEREIVLKLFTIHAILRTIEKRLQPELNFNEACFFAGIVVGREFAQTIISSMLNDNILLAYQGFLDLWARLDTRAAWGKFNETKFMKGKNEVTIRVDNPVSMFEGYFSAPTSLNEFLKGYVFGMVDEGFRAISFLYDESPAFMLPHNALAIKEINVLKTTSKTIFITLTLEPPRLEKAFAQLYKYYYAKNHTDILTLRRSLELAIKETVGLEESSYYSVRRIFKELSRSGIEGIDFSSAHDLYQRLSDLAHRVDKLDAEEASDLFYQTKYFLSELSYYGVSKKKSKAIIRAGFHREPTVDEIQEMEGKISTAVSAIKEEYLKDEKNSSQIEKISKTIQDIETIITFYEDHKLDLQVKEAKVGGETFLEPKDRALLKEYTEKIEFFIEKKQLLEGQLNMLKEDVEKPTKQEN